MYRESECGGLPMSVLRRLRTCSATMPLGFTVVTACYTYVPARADVAPRAGEEVRVRLTEGGSSELTRYFGPRVQELDAELVRIEPDSSLVLGVKTLRTAGGSVSAYEGEGVVSIPRGAVSTIQQRMLSRGRTAVAVTGFVAGLVTVAASALHSGHVSGDQGSGGHPTPP